MYGWAFIFTLVAFFMLAIQVFITYLEFYLVAALSLVLVPFGVFKHTAFIAERAFGSVVSFGVKLMVLVVHYRGGTTRARRDHRASSAYVTTSLYGAACSAGDRLLSLARTGDCRRHDQRWAQFDGGKRRRVCRLINTWRFGWGCCGLKHGTLGSVGNTQCHQGRGERVGDGANGRAAWCGIGAAGWFWSVRTIRRRGFWWRRRLGAQYGGSWLSPDTRRRHLHRGSLQAW